MVGRLVALSVLIPGLLPFLVLLAAFAVVVLLPVVAFTLAATVLAMIPAGAWLLVRRIRGRA
jgi:hypothetical protein